MKGQISLIFLFCSSLSAVFASPLQQNAFQQPNYDHIPKCLQPAVSGMCLAYFPSYYYNPSKETCEQFIYGGCGGSQNRFVTFAECMAACEGAKPEEQDFKLILPSETIDRCSLPSETGPCRAGLPRFYFAGDHCETFLYGGCEGNENNFKSIEECQQVCGTKSAEESVEVAEIEPSSENETEEVAEEEPKSEEVAEDEPKSEEVAEVEPKSEEVEENE